jgi:hypothetical protein
MVAQNCDRRRPELQGALAPVFASVALFGAYLLIKFLPQLDLQTFFNCYFWYAVLHSPSDVAGLLLLVGLCPTLSAGNRQLANQPPLLHLQVDWINSHHWHPGRPATPTGDAYGPRDVTRSESSSSCCPH